MFQAINHGLSLAMEKDPRTGKYFVLQVRSLNVIYDL